MWQATMGAEWETPMVGSYGVRSSVDTWLLPWAYRAAASNVMTLFQRNEVHLWSQSNNRRPANEKDSGSDEV